MNRICINAIAVAVAVLVGAAVPAAAQGPATLRGQVYDCDSRAPIAGAFVTLRSFDDGTTYALRSDARGRFVRVGLMPGSYLVSVAFAAGIRRSPAARLARLESDDVLDVPIGTFDRPSMSSCQPARVPLAIPTSDRYVIH